MFKKEGCKKIINYLDYFNHIYKCEYRTILYECHADKYNYVNKNYEKCGFVGTYKEVEDHFINYEFGLFNCIFCYKNILRINSKKHFETDCVIETIDFKNGYKYIKNKNNSYGIYYYSNGDIYKGSTNGYGTFYYSNGDTYIGEWKNNSREGFGIMHYNNGDKYEGEFKYHYINGYGIYYYSNGDKYEGEFKYNKKEGFGTMYYSNGIIYKGKWKDDQKIK